MDEFRTFEGKSIDDAISQAMAYYDVARAQLEIDIICDAKAGIFGLVGARKAQVKARRRESARRQVEAMRIGTEVEAVTQSGASSPAIPASSSALTGSAASQAEAAAAGDAGTGNADKATEDAPARAEKSRRSRSRQRQARKPAAAEGADGANAGDASAPQSPPASQAQPAPQAQTAPQARQGQPRQSQPQLRQQASARQHQPPARQPRAEAAPVADLTDEQAEAVKERVQQMMEQLLAPLVGEPVLQLSMPEPGKILVGVDAGEDVGLLIGKEGGTLAALQYLANRILAKQTDGPLPRLSLEAGNYKERQDDTLRQLALNLAEKARSSGKAQSTRPLSSYHRRVIHVALQEDGTVVTRSKGEGALKRVVILPKKAKPAAQSGAQVEGMEDMAQPDVQTPDLQPDVQAPAALDYDAAGVEGAEMAANTGATEPSKPRRPRRPRRKRSTLGAAQGNGQTAGPENGAAGGEETGSENGPENGPGKEPGEPGNALPTATVAAPEHLDQIES
ncbi:Jag family protein [Megalodesulfovibrio paquesii]